MTSYAYHSTDPRFPGSIELQKKQYPDARWLPEPQDNGHGGRMMGLTSEGNEVHEYAGLLITVGSRGVPEDLAKIDMARLSRARALIGKSTKPPALTGHDDRLGQVRAQYAHLDSAEFVRLCAAGKIAMGSFHAPLRSIAKRMCERTDADLASYENAPEIEAREIKAPQVTKPPDPVENPFKRADSISMRAMQARSRNRNLHRDEPALSEISRRMTGERL